MILFQIPSAPLLLGQVLKEASPFHIGQVVPRQGKQSPDDRRERAKVGEGTGSLVRFEMLEAYLSVCWSALHVQHHQNFIVRTTPLMNQRNQPEHRQRNHPNKEGGAGLQSRALV